MKQINYLLLLVLLISGTVYSQNSANYSRVKVTISSLLENQKISNAGISIDHGMRDHDTITTLLSNKEINTLKNIGISVEVLPRKVHKKASAKRISNASCSDSATPLVNQYPTPTNFALGSMGGFLTYQEMLDNLDAMQAKFPNLITTRSPIGSFLTNGTTDTSVNPSIGQNPIEWVKISDNPTIDENESEILYTAIHHAREPMSLSQLIYYMWYLLENYETDVEIKQIVDNTELFFVPIINPDGYLYNQVTDPAGGGLWRKNRFNTHGVDNNRNYDHYPNGMASSAVWGSAGVSLDPNAINFPGTNAFSEIENQAMQMFVNSREFSIAMNNHSFGNVLLRPYSYGTGVVTPEENIYKLISEELVSQNNYEHATPSDFFSGQFPGNSDDFMYGGTTRPHRRVFAFSPEIGESFWPDATEIDGISKSMMYLNLTAARMTNNFAKASSALTLNFTGSNTTTFEASVQVKRLGVNGNGNFTVSIVPVSDNILSVENPKAITDLRFEAPQITNFNIQLKNTVNVNDAVVYDVMVDGGAISNTTRVSLRHGVVEKIVSLNGDNITSFINNGWATTTETSVSPNSSITDSPNSEYTSNENKTIEFSQPINLVNVRNAFVAFYAKWDLSLFGDYVQLQISKDNKSTWEPACGNYTIMGIRRNLLPIEPLYTDEQLDWVREQIDLSNFIGETIHIRFQLITNRFDQADGFFFDDFAIYVQDTATSPTLGLETITSTLNKVTVYPNPVTSLLKIELPANTNGSIKINAINGQTLITKKVSTSLSKVNVSSLPIGVYFLEIDINGNKKVFKIVKI